MTNDQAIVYLSDAPPERTPLCTLPCVYRELDAWLADKPAEWSHAAPTSPRSR